MSARLTSGRTPGSTAARSRRSSWRALASSSICGPRWSSCFDLRTNPVPVMPDQPCFIERIAYAADTSAGKRKYFDRLQIVFDTRATSMQLGDVVTTSRVAGAATIVLDFDASGFREPTHSLETAI